MVALQRFGNGESPVASAKLNLVVDALTGAGNTPINHGGVNDAVNYALTVRNQDAAGKAAIIYAPDGVTVLFQVTAAGVLASPTGGAAAAIVTATGTQTLTNKTLGAGTLVSAGVIAKKQLDFTAATDLISGLAAATGAWSGMGGLAAQSFTVDDANSVVLLILRLGLIISNGTTVNEMASRLLLDGTTGYQVGAANISASAGGALTGGIVAVTGLAAGSHTLTAQYYAGQAATLFLRPATSGNQEFLSLQAVEVK